MSDRLIGAAATLVILFVIGVAGYFSLGFSDTPTRAVAAATRARAAPSEEPIGDAHQRAIAAFKLQTQAANKFLTGDLNGRAEWRPAVAGFYTACGITPEGRYLVAKNALGTARYDEPAEGNRKPFVEMWARINCEASAPVNQVRIMRAAERAKEARIDEEMYNLTHPINPTCLMASLRAVGQTGKDINNGNPHYCQDGSYEREQAAAQRAADAAAQTDH